MPWLMFETDVVADSCWVGMVGRIVVVVVVVLVLVVVVLFTCAVCRRCQSVNGCLMHDITQ